MEIIEFKSSRIISFQSGSLPPVAVQNAKVNKEDFPSTSDTAGQENEKEWDFLFSPQQYDDEISLEQFECRALTTEKMQEYGIKASIIRQDIIERALQWEKEHV